MKKKKRMREALINKKSISPPFLKNAQKIFNVCIFN